MLPENMASRLKNAPPPVRSNVVMNQSFPAGNVAIEELSVEKLRNTGCPAVLPPLNVTPCAEYSLLALSKLLGVVTPSARFSKSSVVARAAPAVSPNKTIAHLNRSVCRMISPFISELRRKGMSARYDLHGMTTPFTTLAPSRSMKPLSDTHAFVIPDRICESIASRWRASGGHERFPVRGVAFAVCAHQPSLLSDVSFWTMPSRHISCTIVLRSVPDRQEDVKDPLSVRLDRSACEHFLGLVVDPTRFVSHLCVSARRSMYEQTEV